MTTQEHLNKALQNMKMPAISPRKASSPSITISTLRNKFQEAISGRKMLQLLWRAIKVYLVCGVQLECVFLAGLLHDAASASGAVCATSAT